MEHDRGLRPTTVSSFAGAARFLLTMIAKRLAWIVVCLVALIAFWVSFRPEPPHPDMGGLPKAVSNSNSTVSAAAGWPRATKIRQSASSRAGSTNEISEQALLLGQSTQAVGITYETFSKFTSRDVDYLNRCYRDRTNLLDRLELTRVLGVVGNEETVKIFIRCLMEEQAGKVLTDHDVDINLDPEFVLWATLTSLGVLASQFNSAFAYLKQGVRPEYWHTAINWQSYRGPSSPGLMANWAIQALGNTGRAEAREILLELFRNPPTPWPPGAPKSMQRTFEGAITSAAFRLDYIEQYGAEVAKSGKGPDPRFVYPVWEKSEKGKIWLQKKP